MENTKDSPALGGDDSIYTTDMPGLSNKWAVFNGRYEDATLIDLVELMDATRQHLFAAECAERALIHYEYHYPGDHRPRIAVETRRLFARGEVSETEWNQARREAARASRETTGYRKREAFYAARAASGVADWGQLDALFVASQAVWAMVEAWDIRGDRDAHPNWEAVSEAEKDWQRQRAIEVLGGALD